MEKDQVIIEVINKNASYPYDYDFYIGRGSPLGNPYTGSKVLSRTKAMYQVGSREEAIECYEKYLRERILLKDVKICETLNRIWRTLQIYGKVRLICFCKPLPCHGDIIKKIIEEKL